MEAQGSRPRRTFTSEYKAGVVDLCRTGGKSIGEVAHDLDLTESVLRRWIKQAAIDAGDREGLTTGEREELTGWAKRCGCCGRSGIF